MREIIDLSGQKFNKLTAVSRNKINNKAYWLCDCECGNQTNVELSCLRSGKTQSCGCFRKEKGKDKLKNLEGMKFNNLLVMKNMGKNKSGNYAWLCQCDCGNEKVISSAKIISNHTRSCGCLWKKSITKHGLHGKKGYTAHLLSDPIRKLRRYVGNRIRDTMKARKAKKDGNIFDYLPYSPEELKLHLESLWESWMNWDNYGGSLDDISTQTWHIDHIVPQIKFKFSSMKDAEFSKCWALGNLRPLEKMANCKKGYK